MNLFDLTGKTALITGSSKGIGRAIAVRMAEAGAHVIVSSRKQDACQAVVDDIVASGGTATAIACNVSDHSQVTDLVEQSFSAAGQVDILVGNAAANPYYGPTVDVPESAFDKIMATNVKANIWLCKALLPHMAERRDGAVIIISSIAGLRGTDDIGVYGLSKAADSSLARSLAVGWGEHNIRVNCIAPGLVKTDFAKALWDDPDKLRETQSVYPLGRIGDPDDIAGMAICLASRAGAFITGQTIVVDGGVTIASARA